MEKFLLVSSIFLEFILFLNASEGLNLSSDENCGVYDNKFICSILPINFFLVNFRNEKLKNTTILKAAHFFTFPVNALKKGKLLANYTQNIEHLRFFNASIESIDNNFFDDFPILKTLEIEYNLINSIDEHILTEELGSRLITLSLRDNNLTQLSPKAFQYLKSLQKLDLSGNVYLMPLQKPGYFPESLANLKELNLGFCNISTLDDNIFVNLRSLETLSLYANPLISIPKAINNLSNLLKLGFGKTNTSIFRYSEDVKNGNLQSISFSYTENLTSIESCAFCNFPLLQKISCEECKKLQNIHENAFGSISLQKPLNIKDFYIRGTNISSLSEKLLNWKNLEGLYISGNPFTCDCRMAWLAEDITHNKNHWNDILEYHLDSIDDLTCLDSKTMQKINFMNFNFTKCL